MTGTGLLKRIALVLVGTTCFLIFLGVVNAHGTPIKPDVRKILQQRQKAQALEFAPARAGWDGPEIAPAAQPNSNALLESIGPAASERAVRTSLQSALWPDPRAIAAIVLVIFLLRRIRRSPWRRTANVEPASAPGAKGVAPEAEEESTTLRSAA